MTQTNEVPGDPVQDQQPTQTRNPIPKSDSEVDTDSSSQPIRVGIGLIERDGCYLIRRRPPLPGSPMPGVWEFPGGKCEPGESPEAATLRECLEETGLSIRLKRLRRKIRHQYPHGLVELHYFDAQPLSLPSEPNAESGFQWVPAIDLPTRTFPEANAPILKELAQAQPSGRP